MKWTENDAYHLYEMIITSSLALSHKIISIKAVESVQNKNLICLLDIDIQGAQNVKKSSLDAIYLFIAPPSMDELEKRLRGRGTESEEAMQRRLANAKGELEYGTKDGNFDAVLVNNDLDKTLIKMAQLFEGWFPELLGGLEAAKDAPSAQDQNGGVPPPICDPLSFPRTAEGLTALLSEIDQDAPLEGYVQSDLTYQASNIYVAAGKTLDIPLPPVEQDGSKIEWNVTVVDPHGERLDIEFGLFVIVNGEEVAARDMGRITSPVESADEEVSAKGKFTVANSAPVTVLIKLDNSYSWIKSKKVNYSFNIKAPVDENMIQRSLRAKSVVPKILEGQKALVGLKAEEMGRAEKLRKMESDMEEKVGSLTKQIEEGQKTIKTLQTRALEAEEEAKAKAAEIKNALAMAKKEEQSIADCTSSIVALEEECARLRKQWEELKVERSVREEEKAQKEKDAKMAEQERIALQEEIVAKKEEEQSTLKGLESVESEKKLLQDNLDGLGKERQEREEEGQKYGKELSFLQKMLDAVKLRFVEQKSEV